MGDELQWIADEVARIERELEGAVDLTVFRDSRFRAVSNRLHVRFSFMERATPFIDSHSSLVDPLTPRWNAYRSTLPFASFDITSPIGHFPASNRSVNALQIGLPGREPSYYFNYFAYVQ